MARIRIDRLALQVTGLSESESHSLVMQLAARLAESPVPGSSRRIEALQVAVTMLDNPPPDRLLSRIVDELLQSVAREAW